MTGRRLLRIILGLVAANVVGVAFCFAFVLLFQFPDKVGLPSRAQQWFYGFAFMAIWPSLVWFRWRWELRPHISGEAFPSVYGSISCGGLLLRWLLPSVPYLFFKEGAVCLLIGFPILFVCGFAGVLVGRLLFKSKTAAMNLSVIPVLLIATLTEGKLRQDQPRRCRGSHSHQCSGRRSVELRCFVSYDRRRP
jgi:hypothetical protein